MGKKKVTGFVPIKPGEVRSIISSDLSDTEVFDLYVKMKDEDHTEAHLQLALKEGYLTVHTLLGPVVVGLTPSARNLMVKDYKDMRQRSLLDEIALNAPEDTEILPYKVDGCWIGAVVYGLEAVVKIARAARPSVKMRFELSRDHQPCNDILEIAEESIAYLVYIYDSELEVCNA